MKVPTEEFEQAQLVQWLEANEYLFCASFSGLKRSPQAQAKARRHGLRPGFPDLTVLLKSGELLFIELKRVKGGKVSTDQARWLARLSRARQGVHAEICRGAEEAKKLIARLEAEV